MSQIEDFTRYSKISETFAYFSNGNTLKFAIKLKRVNKETGEDVYFHREYKYKTDDGNIERSINLVIMSAGWQLGKSNDVKNYVYINTGNLIIVRYHLQKILNEWYLGDNSIYGLNKAGNLSIKGKWKPVQIPFDDYNYIEFIPIIITYENGVSIQGCKVTINDKNNFIDMTINEFLNLYSCLFMDTGALISGLLNYVKTPPYGINETRIGESFNRDPNERVKNFFTNNEQNKQ